MKKLALGLAIFLLCAGPALAAVAYRNAVEEQRFRALAEELRCVMCQNQSLADSNALIAKDLRREILLLMRDGKSDDEIKQYLVARYGEFILYRPAVKPMTWLLWFGPALLLIGGGLVIGKIVKKRSALASNLSPTDNEQEW